MSHFWQLDTDYVTKIKRQNETVNRIWNIPRTVSWICCPYDGDMIDKHIKLNTDIRISHIPHTNVRPQPLGNNVYSLENSASAAVVEII